MMTRSSSKLNLPLLIFMTCLLFTFLLWDHYFNSQDAMDRQVFSNLILFMGVLFSSASGLFMWSLERAKYRLEDQVTKRTAEIRQRNQDLEKALQEIKTLQGFIPICASCKKVRNDRGLWQQMEIYLEQHSDARFSHTVCKDCAAKLYPGYHVRQ